MTVDIFDISTEGEGIGRIDGKIVFVPRALPG
ncbi:MAG: TRAM domain-containing protein, partial [Firmicutes bacterium]|nr:TRAM domain-containing protein [Bacillota bacterium]